MVFKFFQTIFCVVFSSTSVFVVASKFEKKTSQFVGDSKQTGSEDE